MSSTAAELVLQGIRAWLKATVGLTDAQVIPGYAPNPRPPLPYITVTLTAWDIPDGTYGSVVNTEATTLVVGTASAGTVYTVTVNGHVCNYTRTSGDTNASVAIGLAALVQALDDVLCSVTGATIAIVPQNNVTLTVTTADPNLTKTDGLPARYVISNRTAVASIQGFSDPISTTGALPSNWMSQAMLMLQFDSVQSVLDAAGITIVQRGGQRNINRLLDTQFEPRSLLEVDVLYALQSPIDVVVPLESVAIHTTIEEGSGSNPVVFDTTVTL